GPIHTGPLLKLQKVSIASNGEVDVKLNSWIPTIKIKQVEHLANGDTVLHTTIGIGPFKITKTLAHLNFDLSPVLAHWPPSAEVAVGGMAKALEGLAGAGSGSSSAVTQLAGKVDWSLKASAHDPD